MHLWGHRADIVNEELIITGKLSFVAISLALLMLLVVLLPLVLLAELINGNSNASANLVILALLFFWTIAGVGLYLALYKTAISNKFIFDATKNIASIKTQYLKQTTINTFQLDSPLSYQIKWFQSIQSIDSLFVTIVDSKNQKIPAINSSSITQFGWGSKVLLKTIEEYFAKHKIKKASN